MSGNSGIYPSIRQKFANATFNWTVPGGNGIKVALLASSFVFSAAAVYLADIDSAQIIVTTPVLISLTATNGYLGAATASFGVIADSRLAAFMLFYQDTGVAGTSQLIAFLDTPDLTGLPVVLSGFAYYLYANSAYGGWFRL